MANSLTQYIFEDDLKSFILDLKSKKPEILISQKFKPFRNFKELNILEYAIALGKVDFIDVIFSHLGSWDYKVKNRTLDYDTLETTLKLLELLTIESFENDQKGDEDDPFRKSHEEFNEEEFNEEEFNEEEFNEQELVGEVEETNNVDFESVMLALYTL